MKDMMARRAEESDSASMAINMEYTLAMQQTGEDVRQENKTISKFNRDTLDELLALLDDSSGSQLQRAYKRASHPNIYQDNKSGQRFISAAKNMGDLSDDQRMSVNIFELEFQSKYEVLCDKMVDIYEKPSYATSTAFNDPEFMNEFMQRHQDLQVIQFDRNELNAKAKRRLRQILSPVQLERIGLQTATASPG